MLLDNMFINFIDTQLQDKIALSDDLGTAAAEALKILLNKTLTLPMSMTKDLQNWTIEEHGTQHFLFYKGKHYIPCNTEL